MRIDLPQNFLERLADFNRSPVLLIVFHFRSRSRFLSDQPIGLADGFSQDYEPIVESWGSLKDNVRIEPIIGSNSLEVRQGSLSIINMAPDRFSEMFKDENPENVRVDLYQWFRDIPPADAVLIDRFVCQDPITISEAQANVKIGLVSPIMASNNFVWGPNRQIETRYPMVVGKVQTPAFSMKTAPYGILLYDIDQNYTGIIYLDVFENENVDFPESGIIYIDSEKLSYSDYAVTKMTINGRGQEGTTARPHIRGARVTWSAGNYDYSLSAGPVAKIDNITGDGEPYVNQYTVFPGENPTFIRFQGRPPWHRVELGNPGIPITPPEEQTTQYGVSTEQYTSQGGSVSNDANVNSASGAAWLHFDNTVGQQETSTNNYPVWADWWQSTEDIVEPRDIDRLTTGTSFYSSLYHKSDEIGRDLELDDEFGFKFKFPDLSSLGSFVSLDRVSCVAKSNGTMNMWGGAAPENLVEIYCNGEKVFTSRRLYGNTFWSISLDDRYFSGLGLNSWSAIANAEWEARVKINRLTGDLPTKFEFQLRQPKIDVTYYPPVSATYPTQEIASHFNRDLSSLGAFRDLTVQVNLMTSDINCTVDNFIYQRSTNNPANNSQLWSRRVSSYQGYTTISVKPNINSMAALQSLRIAVRQRLVSPTSVGSRRYSSTYVAWIKWIVTYQPGDIDQPDEERVVYVNQLYADVTSSLGELVTPPQAIEELITTVGELGDKIDRSNFDEYRILYENAGFYFSGLIDGETRFHDALKDMIRQAGARIAYNAGEIKFVSNFIKKIQPVVTSQFNNHVEEMRRNPSGRIWAQHSFDDDLVYFFKDDIRERSITEQRMRFADVINKVTAKYDPDPLETEWRKEYIVEDDQSVADIGLQETTVEYDLVRDESIVQQLVDHILEMRGVPRVFTTFRVYMKAFVLEKSDNVYFQTEFKNYGAVTGPVITINRIFGSGKDRRMNIYEVTIMSFPVPTHLLDFYEIIEIHEIASVQPEFQRVLNFAETINISETVETLQGFATPLNINEIVQISESLDLNQILPILKDIYEIVQVNDSLDLAPEFVRTLELLDQVEISENIIADKIVPILKGIQEFIEISEELDLFTYTTHSLDVTEVVQISDTDIRFDQGIGYGADGYGIPPYGGDN